MSKKDLKPVAPLKWIMLLTCIASICCGLCVDFLHAYKFSALRICIICMICFFTYRKKRVAEICYYLFSSFVIFAGAISIVVSVIKFSRGILPGIRYEVIIIYIIRAIVQIGLLHMVVRLKKQENRLANK